MVRAEVGGPSRSTHSTSRALGSARSHGTTASPAPAARYRSSNQAVGSPGARLGQLVGRLVGIGRTGPCRRLCPARRRPRDAYPRMGPWLELRCSGTARGWAPSSVRSGASLFVLFNAWPLGEPVDQRRHRDRRRLVPVGPPRDHAGPRGPGRRPAGRPSDAGVLDRRGARGDPHHRRDPAGHPRPRHAQRLAALGRDRARGALAGVPAGLPAGGVPLARVVHPDAAASSA